MGPDIASISHGESEGMARMRAMQARTGRDCTRASRSGRVLQVAESNEVHSVPTRVRLGKTNHC